MNSNANMRITDKHSGEHTRGGATSTAEEAHTASNNDAARPQTTNEHLRTEIEELKAAMAEEQRKVRKLEKETTKLEKKERTRLNRLEVHLAEKHRELLNASKAISDDGAALNDPRGIYSQERSDPRYGLQDRYGQESNFYPQGSSGPRYDNTGSRYDYNGGSYYDGRDPRAQYDYPHYPLQDNYGRYGRSPYDSPYDSPYQRHGYGGGPEGGRYPGSDCMGGSSYGYPFDRSYGTIPRSFDNQDQPELRASNYGRSVSPQEKAPRYRERSGHRLRKPDSKPKSSGSTPDSEPEYNLANLADISVETNPRDFLLQIKQRDLMRQRAGTKADVQKKDETKKDDDNVEMDGHDPRIQEIESLRAALRECKADMQRSDADLATKQKEADEALAKVARLQQDNTEGNAELKRVNTELQQLTAQVTQLKHNLEIEQGKYSQANDVVLARDDTIVSFTNTITARNKVIRDLNKTVGDLSDTNSGLNKTIRDLRSQVNNMTSTGEVAAPYMAANGPASGQNAGPEQGVAPEQDAPTGETVQPAAGLGQVKAEPEPDLDLLGGSNAMDHKTSA